MNIKLRTWQGYISQSSFLQIDMQCLEMFMFIDLIKFHTFPSLYVEKLIRSKFRKYVTFIFKIINGEYS